MINRSIHSLFCFAEQVPSYFWMAFQVPKQHRGLPAQHSKLSCSLTLQNRSVHRYSRGGGDPLQACPSVFNSGLRRSLIVATMLALKCGDIIGATRFDEEWRLHNKYQPVTKFVEDSECWCWRCLEGQDKERILFCLDWLCWRIGCRVCIHTHTCYGSVENT